MTKRRKIEESLRKKEHLALIGEMSAGIAHEIRNPLASISGSIQFIKNELKLNEDMKNLMDIVIKESKRLSDSIEEFLQFTKTPPIENTKFDLFTSLEELSEFIIKKNPDLLIRKKYNSNIFVNGDERRIRQVIYNIVNNSVKAVRESGLIEISVFKRNSMMYLSVKDNGIGMSKKEVEKIFIPFYTKFTSGIGLGMSLVKRILDEHGFPIDIISKAGVGTEVIICFSKT